MDESRADVKENDFVNYYSKLAENIDGKPSSLVFSMDEAGQDEYIDTHSYKVVVQSNFPDKTTNIPIRGRKKLSTLVHTITDNSMKNNRLCYIKKINSRRSRNQI